jgi:hypothetical protein
MVIPFHARLIGASDHITFVCSRFAEYSTVYKKKLNHVEKVFVFVVFSNIFENTTKTNTFSTWFRFFSRITQFLPRLRHTKIIRSEAPVNREWDSIQIYCLRAAHLKIGFSPTVDYTRDLQHARTITCILKFAG